MGDWIILFPDTRWYFEFGWRRVPEGQGHWRGHSWRKKNAAGALHSKEHKDAFVVYLEKLNVLTAGETVTPALLVEKKVAKLVSGRVPRIKILDKGEIKVKLTIKGCGVSAGARKKIEAVGGTIA